MKFACKNKNIFACFIPYSPQKNTIQIHYNKLIYIHGAITWKVTILWIDLLIEAGHLR